MQLYKEYHDLNVSLVQSGILLISFTLARDM